LKNIKYLLYIVCIISFSGYSYLIDSANSAQIDLSAGQTWGTTRGGIQSNFDEVYSAIENTYIQDLLTGVISGSELQLSGADGDRRITLSPNTTFDATLKDPGTNRIIDLAGIPGYVDTSNVFHAFGSGGVGGYVSTPTYSDSTGTVGQWSFDASYIYVCEATNQWDRYPVTFAGWDNPTPTPPTITGLTLAANGTTLTMVASEAITAGTGFSVADLECVGPVTGTVGMTHTSGNTAGTWMMELASPMLRTSEEGVVVFNWAGTADGIEDGEGTDLAAITGMAVTNNSTQTGATCSGTGTLGVSTGGVSTGTSISDLTQFTAGSNICITRGGIQTTTDFTASYHLKFVIYADNAGVPGELLATSDEMTGDGTANVQEVAFSTPFQIVSGVTYWRGYVSDQVFTYNWTGNTGDVLARYYDPTYATYPTPEDPYAGSVVPAKQIVFYIAGTP